MTVQLTIQYVAVEGSPKSMGHAHGEQLRETITDLADVRLGLLLKNSGRDLERAENIIRGVAKNVETTLPRVYEETAAIARAANLEYWKLLAAGAFSDLCDLLGRPESRETLHECTLTSIVVQGRAVLVGTWDTHASAVDALVLCRRRPTGLPETLALTTAGWPMQQGVTEAGLAFAISNLVAAGVGSTGVPYIAALPHVLEAKSLDEAVMTIHTLSHLSGRFYLLSDGVDSFGLEVAPSVGVASASSTWQCHTNHYLIEPMIQHEGRADALAGSRRRLAAASEWLMSQKDIKTHSGLLNSFINAGTVQSAEYPTEDQTGAAFVLDPSERTIHFLSSQSLRALAKAESCSISTIP